MNGAQIKLKLNAVIFSRPIKKKKSQLIRKDFFFLERKLVSSDQYKHTIDNSEVNNKCVV